MTLKTINPYFSMLSMNSYPGSDLIDSETGPKKHVSEMILAVKGLSTFMTI